MAGEFAALLDALARRALHEQFMEIAMHLNVALKGAPYGPTLNETQPSKLRGLVI